ncbi:MAG: hypothetical protein RLZ10_254 [Bacteroidota bacterium]|jgi:hypothetical protein
MKIILFLFLLLFLNEYSTAQQNISNDQEIITGFDGTFQIEIHQVRYQPNIPGNILEIIAQNRRDIETTYYHLDQNIRIRIPSKQEIDHSHWQPLKLISYVD